ncbi:MAG: nucleoside 2-deoxyribosyltransferase [Candidatus Heimdallarchaeota archaeon]
MLQIYLSGAIRGGRELQPTYERIYGYLDRNGVSVLAHHVAAENVLEIENSTSEKEIFVQDIQWLNQCDGVVAEVSIPSLGVGYEISYALETLKKPVLALYREDLGPISVMILGNISSLLTISPYRHEEDLLFEIKQFINSLF